MDKHTRVKHGSDRKVQKAIGAFIAVCFKLAYLRANYKSKAYDDKALTDNEAISKFAKFDKSGHVYFETQDLVKSLRLKEKRNKFG